MTAVGECWAWPCFCTYLPDCTAVSSRPPDASVLLCSPFAYQQAVFSLLPWQRVTCPAWSLDFPNFSSLSISLVPSEHLQTFSTSQFKNKTTFVIKLRVFFPCLLSPVTVMSLPGGHSGFWDPASGQAFQSSTMVFVIHTLSVRVTHSSSLL